MRKGEGIPSHTDLPSKWELEREADCDLCPSEHGRSDDGQPTASYKAAKSAVEAASHSLRELRIAEVVKQDMVITDGKVEAYRTKVRVSFKYEGNE